MANPTSFVYPKIGLSANPTGGIIPLSGSLDGQLPPSVGHSTTVPLAETVLPGLNSSGVGSDGIIDISMCSNLGLYVDFLLGSLVSMDLWTEFSNSLGPTFYKRGYPGIAAATGIVTVVPIVYRFTADYLGIIPIMNPGAKFLRFKSTSTAVITGSALTVGVVRSCSGIGNPLAG